MKRMLLVGNIRHAFTRVFALGAYLPEYGWAATVLTPLPPGTLNELGASQRFLERATLAEAPYRGDVFATWRRLLYRRGFSPEESVTEQLTHRLGAAGEDSVVEVLAGWLRAVLAYPDAERTWTGRAVAAAGRLLGAQPFDAILSSSPFPTSHIVAARLKERYGLPWLADFRDPWTQNQAYPYGPTRRRVEEGLERRVLRSADLLTAAAPAYAAKIQRFHGRPVSAIPVGFDPDTVNSPPVGLSEKFTITYVGTIYEGEQDPVKFLRALGRVIDRHAANPGDIEVRFYGRRYQWLSRQIEALGLDGVVRQCGVIPRGQALQRQYESHVLLLLNWEDPRDRGWYPRKLFEYLAAQRPILASGGLPADAIEGILHSTRAGVYACTPEEIENALIDFYTEYARLGHTVYQGDAAATSRFSYREVARQFAGLLDEIASPVRQTAHARI